MQSDRTLSTRTCCGSFLLSTYLGLPHFTGNQREENLKKGEVLYRAFWGEGPLAVLEDAVCDVSSCTRGVRDDAVVRTYPQCVANQTKLKYDHCYY